MYGTLAAVRENGAAWAGAAGYNTMRRLTGITRGTSATTSYGYEPVSRLASLAQNPAGTANNLTLSFCHNPAGQIVTRTVSNSAYAFAPATGTTAI